MEPDSTELDMESTTTRTQSSTPPMRMEQPETARDDIFANHRRLIQWVLANDGYFHPDVQIAFSERKGFHTVVAEGAHIAGGTRIASCPMSTTISVLNAFDVAPFSNHGTRFPDSFLRNQADCPQSSQAFFLLEQLVLGDKSWWAPYISSLPTVEDVSHSQFEDEADLLWLEGTNLKAGFAAEAARWKEMYLKGMHQLKQSQWENAVNGAYTWERFRWAMTIFGSRSFTSQVLDATLPADKALLQQYRHDDGRDLCVLGELFAQHFGVLLPLVDISNHKPGAKVEWQARYSFVGLQVLEPYESGQEIFNNYGPRDNETLLVAYGFTIPDNPFDHVVISIRAPPGSPLEIARKWQPDLRSDPERRCFIFTHQHPQSTSARSLETALFSFDLLDSVSVLCANEREVQTMYTRQQTLMSYCLQETPRFEDGRLVLATVSQLLRDCSQRAARLRATDPTTMNAGVTPSNYKQQNAKVYRDSQLNMVETAAAVCKFVLKVATSEDASETILANLRQELPESIFDNLQTLVNRHGRLTHPHELLSSTGLLEMLPQSLSTSLQNCLSEIESNLQRISDAVDPTSLEKGRLAVMLSALYGEYLHGTRLPHRISAWLQQLVEWYPPDSELWSYVPTPGPWVPGEEPPPDLMNLLAARAAISPRMPAESNIKRWLRPERVCWGWNVMEEEMVRVPTNVFQVPGDQAESEIGRSLNSQVLIYWQRY
ncbi:hypothetical protein HRR83_005401 [Exophiala dermatitidis]|uniref:Uncharacterized protein n=2 Tax=Exophiala dermatitidis TaxID=5970 RepID=H6C4S0_EXODN|nr:uncharacterized protein HMPREF1120_05719 [Exophiala dermatitidis NIH/UT8656]KAJ4513048.1 hypothetical protein HRR75_004815 [Exophiala dermatitidis]EHY57691.1 hypothetical protein HMPREF1120_05719 [Exophiala dermatitidis NIH/UT8656]KAJ4516097.1 hypothetical protein HRR74_005254 [Exophiala dermatitidis]KAJ4518498.1 hypothetical protein HRR73_004079 [Exophiala dermatitidis]KAJ4554491.1 hypothetical protein HRR78_002895 [Exophiala dermatitidis]